PELRVLDNSGVVHQGVDAAVAGHHALHHGGDAGLVDHVDHEPDRLTTGAFDLRHNGVHAFAVEVTNHHPSPLARKLEGGGVADSARRAGDDANLVLQPHWSIPLVGWFGSGSASCCEVSGQLQSCLHTGRKSSISTGVPGSMRSNNSPMSRLCIRMQPIEPGLPITAESGLPWM